MVRSKLARMALNASRMFSSKFTTRQTYLIRCYCPYKFVGNTYLTVRPLATRCCKFNFWSLRKSTKSDAYLLSGEVEYSRPL